MKQSLHSFHRCRALRLVVMLLASLMLPAAASAEGILSGADAGQEQAQEAIDDTAGAPEAAGSGGSEAAPESSSPADEPVSQDAPEQKSGLPEEGSGASEQPAPEQPAAFGVACV